MADTDKTLSLRIKAEAEGEKEIAALTKQVENLKSEAAKPIPDPTETFTKGIKEADLSAEALGKELGRLTNETKQFSTVTTAATQELDKTSTELKRTAQESKSSSDNATLFKDALQSLIALGAAKYFVDTADAMTKLKTGLDQVNGSAEQTNEDLSFLTGVSNKLGLSLSEVGQQYLSLAAASKGTNLEGVATKNIFESVVIAMTALGKTGPEVEQALTAIQQIMSKGKLSAEELRGQLGEALPGAFQIAAKSVGVTTAALDKMLEQGQIFSEEFLPGFARELNNTFGNTKPIETWQASFNRLLNDVNDTLVKVSETGVAKLGQSIIEFAGSAVLSLKSIPIAAENIGSGIGAATAALATGGDAVAAFADETRSMTQELEDLVFQIIGTKTQAEFLAETQRKLAEETEKSISPLQRLQDAAKTDNFAKLDQSIRTAIDGIQKTGDVAKGAQEALKKFVETPAQLAEPTKILELANVIQLIGSQADNSANQLREGLGKALEKLTSEQLLALQTQAQSALDSVAKGNDDARLAFMGLGDIIESVAIASLNKLGIDGVEALKKVDAGFQDIIGALTNLSENASVSGEVLAQAFEKGIDAATTITEIDLVREALVKTGESGKLNVEQISLAMIDVNQKTAELYAAIDPLTKALDQFGIDSTEAFTGLDAEMRASIQTLDVLANSARITGDVLYQAISESIDAANTVKELETLKAKVEEFGRSGELSGGQVKQAIAELNVKLQDANKEIDPLAKAFDNLGVTSAKELKAIADQAQVSFDLIKNSGKATTSEIEDAFAALAEKQLKAAAAQGKEAELATQLRLTAIAETGRYGTALDEIVKKFTQVEDKSRASGDAQTENIQKTTQALKEQQEQLREIEHSMAGIQVATITVGDRMAAAFDTQGIRQFNALAQDVTNWLDQANAAISSLNGGDWRSVNSARYLAESMGEVSGYMDDTVKTVREDLVSAIQDATNEMRRFADIQKDALQKAVEDLEDLKAKNNEFAQEQLRHKREEAELEKALAEAKKQRNQEAIDAITEQMRIEDERHKIIMNNLKAEQDESARFGENITNGANSARAAIDNMSTSAHTARQSIQHLTEAGK